MLGAATALAVVAGGTPAPAPTPAVDPNLVTPGVWGFVAIAVIALAVVALILDMMRRIRRGRYRADVRAELDAEEKSAAQGKDASFVSSVDDQDIDPDDRRAP